MKQKIIAAILCVVMLFGLTACGNDTTQPSADHQPSQAENEVFNLSEILDFAKDDVDNSIMEYAARLSADINSQEVPSEEYWEECMMFLIESVERDDWDKVLNCMEWGADVVNTLNVFDVSDYGHKYFNYTCGQLDFLHFGLWHTPIFSHNIVWSKVSSTHTATLEEGATSGYILMQNPFYGVYIIELTTTLPTTITTMSQPDNTDYNVNGPWVENMVNEAELRKTELFVTAKELMYNAHYEDGMTNQEYWNDFMTFVVENVPESLWHELFTECGYWAYAGDDYYGFPDINRINVNDTRDFSGSVNQWNFANGVFTIPATSYHNVEWSYNVNWDGNPDDYNSDRHATLADPNKDGVILLLFGDYYFHVVQLSNNNPTALTSLAQDFDNEFDILFWNTNIVFPFETENVTEPVE